MFARVVFLTMGVASAQDCPIGQTVCWQHGCMSTSCYDPENGIDTGGVGEQNCYNPETHQCISDGGYNSFMVCAKDEQVCGESISSDMRAKVCKRIADGECCDGGDRRSMGIWMPTVDKRQCCSGPCGRGCQTWTCDADTEECGDRDSPLSCFPRTMASAAAAPMSIVETAQSVPELSSLVESLVAADLVDTLSTDGPFTVFAPTNDAFAAISIPGGGVMTMEHLQHLLQYHVVSGTVMAGDLHNMDQLPTLFSEGRRHTIGVNLEEEGRIRIVGETKAVTVTMADVVCSNGVVHIVNAILMPDFERLLTV